MKDRYIDYQTAVIAKGLGFDNGLYGEHIHINQNLWYTSDGTVCIYRYVDDLDNKSEYMKNTQYLYPRCTQQLLQKWLRKDHNINIVIDNIGSDKYFFKLEEVDTVKKIYEMEDESTGYENTLELALAKALQYLIIRQNE